MSAALLEARRSKFRRENSRREFLNPLSADCWEPAAGGFPMAEGGREASPKSHVPSPTGNAGPEEVDRATGESTQVEFQTEQSVSDPASDAKQLLAEARVQAWLQGKTPSKRNRDVFRAVMVDRRNQRDVAAEFHISQPRVNQILRQVGSWLSHVTCARDQALSPAEQIQLAENVTRMQYDHLYGLALKLSDASQQDTVIVKERKDKNQQVLWTETTTRNNLPRPGFLGVALKAICDQAKFEGIVGVPAARLRNAAGESSRPRSARSAAGASYNPLSDSAPVELPADEEADDSTPDMEQLYAQFPERFEGDFSARTRYYQTQVAEVFGQNGFDPDDEDETAESVDWMQKLDIRAAQVERQVTKAFARRSPEDSSDSARSELRRQLLIKSFVLSEDMIPSDAEGLLEHYDERQGRFTWDVRFEALKQEIAERKAAVVEALAAIDESAAAEERRSRTAVA